MTKPNGSPDEGFDSTSQHEADVTAAEEATTGDSPVNDDSAASSMTDASAAHASGRKSIIERMKTAAASVIERRESSSVSNSAPRDSQVEDLSDSESEEQEYISTNDRQSDDEVGQDASIEEPETAEVPSVDDDLEAVATAEGMPEPFQKDEDETAADTIQDDIDESTDVDPSDNNDEADNHDPDTVPTAVPVHELSADNEAADEETFDALQNTGEPVAEDNFTYGDSEAAELTGDGNPRPSTEETNVAGDDAKASDEQQSTADGQTNTEYVQDSSTSAFQNEEPQNREQRKMASALIAGWGVALLSIAAIAGYGIYNASQTTVPQADVSYSVTDGNTDKICKKFKNADLDCEVYLKNSYDVPGGGFIGQNLDAGSRVKKDNTVKIVYSSGPQFGEMPDVVGLPLDIASDEMSKQGLKIGKTTEVDNSGVAKGRVAGASVRIGSVTDNGDEIDLMISSGVTRAEDFSGISADQAVQKAENAGLNAKIEWVPTGDSESYGTIVDQSVAEDEKITDGQITLYAARPYEGEAIEVPKVTGETRDDAVSKLNEAGITNLNIVEVEGDKDKVLAVTPSESNYVSSESTVTLVVQTTGK